MIVVNYYQEEDYNPDTDGYYLHLAAIVNDSLELLTEIEMIKEAIDNSMDFKPVAGVMYELYLERATIAADPIPERAFYLSQIKRKKYSEDYGWHTPTVTL